MIILYKLCGWQSDFGGTKQEIASNKHLEAILGSLITTEVRTCFCASYACSQVEVDTTLTTVTMLLLLAGCPLK